MILINFKTLFPQEGQTVVFDYVTMIFLIIIISCIIIGIFRGFFSSIISLGLSLGVGILSYFLCKPVSDLLLLNSNIHNAFYNPIYSTISKYNEGILNIEITAENKQYILDFLASDEAKIPDFYYEKISNEILSDSANNTLVSEVFAKNITQVVFYVMTFFVLLLLVGIIFGIIKHFLKKVDKVIKPLFINRLLGGIFGLFEGIFTCLTICFIFYLLISVNIVNENVLNNISNTWFNGLYNDSNWSFSQGLFSIVSQFFDSYLS